MTLVAIFEKEGNANVNATCEETPTFTGEEWKNWDVKTQQQTLMNYRLAFLADSWVNWCPALGTVLANDEVKDGVSERGGHPVEQKLMRQWSMRITAYAERLLQGLEEVDFTDSLKEQQRNWIGKSQGASVAFELESGTDKIEVFTTRPDTIYGVTFMVLAPEHPLVDQITTTEFKEAIANYKQTAALKTERDRQANVKDITGQFTGAYAIHPFTGDKVQIWIGEYVLASYGTGAVMAVPCGDQRDYAFAKHFGIDIPNVFEGVDISKEAYTEKDSVIANSDFLNGLPAKKAIKLAIYEIEKRGIGKGKINYRLRDAIFSRQRYWGEPFHVYYQDDVPYLIDDADLPVTLPEVDKYLPTEDGEPPLARAEKKDWNVSKGDRMEYNTMPGWAGSSWYFLRYMDPHNETEFAAKEKLDYWNQVDLYIGGAEHAVGHLLYSRFWTKFLADRGYLSFQEPFKKLINQGMILGVSSKIFSSNYEVKVHGCTVEIRRFLKEKFGKEFNYDTLFACWRFMSSDADSFPDIGPMILKNMPIEYADFGKKTADIDSFSKSNLCKSMYPKALFITRQGVLFENKFYSFNGEEIPYEFFFTEEQEKMSKSKYNVQTPDELVEKFGADTLRCYEMFLGPLEQFKPWDVKGINGVNNFLKKLWRLFHQGETFNVSTDAPSKTALKTLHKTIKKVTEDLNRYSFNTVVSTMMIAVNELTEEKCNNKQILEGIVTLLAPYAPHICEEFWEKMGHTTSVTLATWPTFDPAMLIESDFEYPISFNGKVKFKLLLPTALNAQEVEKEVMSLEKTIKILDGKMPKKVIVVPKKIVNVVV